MRARNMQKLTDQLKAEHPGITIYGIGDAAHQGSPSGHNEDDTPGSRPDQEDSDNEPEHRAVDAMISPTFTAAECETLVQRLVTRPENRARLYHVIYKRRIWRRNGGWVQEYYGGSDPHDNHGHINGLAANDNDTTPWNIGAAEGEDMTVEESQRLYSAAWRAATIIDDLPAVPSNVETSGANAQAGPIAGQENKLHTRLNQLEAKLDQVLAALADDPAAS